jgi:hypothetical protein
MSKIVAIVKVLQILQNLRFIVIKTDNKTHNRHLNITFQALRTKPHSSQHLEPLSNAPPKLGMQLMVGEEIRFLNRPAAADTNPL